MAPPEVILDRGVRMELRNNRGFSGYVGKLDLERIASPSFRSFLHLIQETMNEALRLEGVNASGGVEHPPFHFDYLDVTCGTENAHTFRHGGFAFIVVTLPMVQLLWDLSRSLSRSPLVQQLLGLDPVKVEPDALQGLLFQIQLDFLVSHEYKHHVHEHCAKGDSSVNDVWTEFLGDAASGGIDSQAQELDADGYAIYIVLAHLLRGDLRQGALQLLAGQTRRAQMATSYSLPVSSWP